MAVRIAIGLAVTVVGLVLVGRRAWFLFRLVSTGRPAPGRMKDVPAQLKAEVMDVFGQRKLLRRPLPGLAHFFTMWGFFILASVYLEAYGTLFQPNFHIPLIGRWAVLGFLQDFFALAVLLGIITFAIIRLRSEPKEYGRESRFYGSHLGGGHVGVGDGCESTA